MLMTFWMNGIGIGMMSPSGPAWARKSLGMPPVGVALTIRWNVLPTSAGLRPAATMLGSQTGMYPPLTTITTAFRRMPTKASGRPGCSRLTHRPISSSRNPKPNRSRR